MPDDPSEPNEPWCVPRAMARRLVVVAETDRSTADLIVECLQNEDVTHVFGIPG